MGLLETVGRTFGKYRVTRPIPNYGLGPCLEVVHVGHGKSCAIRLLPAEMSADKTALDAYRAAASKSSQISHPSLPLIQEIVVEPPMVGAVIPLVPGMSLAKRVSSGGRLPFHEFVSIFRSVITALQALHRAGIVHRAVRPHSIVIDTEGRAHLCDAGMMMDYRNFKGDAAVSMAHYASPEAGIGGPTDYRSDLYSLGATIYFALTGRTPFASSEPLQILNQHLRSKPASPAQFRPDLPSSYATLILKLMEKTPEQRGDDLDHALSIIDPHMGIRKPQAAAPARTSGEHREPLPRPRSRLPILLAALGGVAAAGVVFFLATAEDSPRPAPAAVPARTPGPPPASPTDETYYQEHLAAARDLRSQGRLKEAVERAEQANLFRRGPEIDRLIEELKGEIAHSERMERVRPQIEKIKSMAQKMEDPVAVCFECEEFLRAHSDLDVTREIQTIYDAAKLEVEKRTAKGPITKLPPNPNPPPRRPGPRPPRPGTPPPPPPPPPVKLGPEFDRAQSLVSEKKYSEAKAVLLPMLSKESDAAKRRAIGAELFKCVFDGSPWRAQLNGRDLDGSFHVVRLSDSDLQMVKDSDEITGWAREKDVAMLQLKEFKGGTGVTVECFLESKFQDPHGVGIRLDFQAGNAFKDLYLAENRAAFRRVFKKEDSDLQALPAQGLLKRWVRLTVAAEGDLLLAFANTTLIYSCPLSETKLGEDIRIVLWGCSARLRDVRARF